MDRTERRIKVQNVTQLQTLPVTLTNIIEVANDPMSSGGDLGKVIQTDQAISSMLLKLVNSAFYGNLRNVSSITHAIALLGFQMVKTMAMSVSIFRPPEGSRSSFDRQKFWVHSIGSATIAKRLLPHCAQKNGGMDGDTTFLSVLLHDVGKVIFDNYFTEEYQDVIETARLEKRWIGDVEREVLEMDHAEAGYYLANKWQFPEKVVNTIKYHHRLKGALGDSNIGPALAHISDCGCRLIKLGDGGDGLVLKIDNLALKMTGLTVANIDKVLKEMEEDREKIEAFSFK